MKWRIYNNKRTHEADKKFPITILLSREGSSELQLEEINCGNYNSPRSAIKFIQSVKKAKIKFEVNNLEEEKTGNV